MRRMNGLWKKTWVVSGLALGLCAVLVSGCSKNKLAKPTTESISEVVTEVQTRLPNPMEEVEDPQDFEKIGVHMIAPPDGTEFKYFIINGEVAEMQFTMDEAVYIWRASDTAEDFAGIFERFKEEIITEEYTDGTYSVQIEIKSTDSGSRLASWAWGSTKYTLYTPNKVTDAAIKDMAFKLAELSENEK